MTFIICCTGHIIYLHLREHSALARYIHGSLSVYLRYPRRHQLVIRSHLLLFPLSLKPCCIAHIGKYCIFQHLVLYKCSLKFHLIKSGQPWSHIFFIQCLYLVKDYSFFKHCISFSNNPQPSTLKRLTTFLQNVRRD